MKSRRFVNPSITRLALSEGDWIEVRDELSVGEERKAMASAVSSVDMKGTLTPNLENLGISETFAYLVDWSFTDANGKPVKLDESALRNLTTDAYKEIETALQAHVKSVKEAQGKATTDSASSTV